MFRNILKTAVRSLSKNKGFTFLNIAGLALGLTVCLVIVIYVADELSFDRYNTHSDNIFRVNTESKFSGTSTSRAIAAPAVAGALLRTFPEIANTVRLMPSQERFKKGDEFIFEKAVYSDASIFSIFSLPMIAGNANTALEAPHSIVVTESAAKRYFNTTDIIDKTLTIAGDENRNTVYKITGVIRDIPAQSHFNFDFFISMTGLGISRNKNFAALFPFSTYLLLNPGASYKNLEAKFPAWMWTNIDFLADMEKNGDYIKLNLTPLKDIHLHSNRTNELAANGNIQYLYIFSIIAIFIFLLACINFMNLSTARSVNRAREVGVRKLLGSTRKSLIIQFLCESFMVTFIAALIALLAAWAILPAFGQLAGKHLLITVSMMGRLLPFLAAIIVIAGALAGAYPAFFLSGFQTIRVLKGKAATGFKNGMLRNGLVVFQFSISVFLIIGTLVIYNQLHYIQDKNLGFNRNQVLVVNNMNTLGSNAAILKQEVRQLPGVSGVTLSSFLPTGSRRWINYVSNQKDVFQTQFWPVDEDYIATMNMTIVKGRDFSNLFLTDSSGIIINETAAKMFGYFNDPLNKKILYGSGEKEYHIIGVVKDFNFSSLRDNIAPVVMMLLSPFEKKKQGGEAADALCIRTNANNLPALLAEVESKWYAIGVHQHFDYSFMDEDFDAAYRTEQRMGKLFVIFTVLTIIIACLGLFGLAAYATEQRTKEISIRKVLGADVSAIVALLSRDFIKLVIISIFIAVPLAWVAMQKWLQEFAYRTSIDWWVPVLAAVAAMVIAFMTVSFQSIKAARSNPVKNLKAE